jgi:hypothetical protein
MDFQPPGLSSLPFSLREKASPLYQIFAERGDNSKNYSTEELEKMCNDCSSILDDLKKIFPKHSEKEYIEGIRRFAAKALMSKTLFAIKKT